MLTDFVLLKRASFTKNHSYSFVRYCYGSRVMQRTIIVVGFFYYRTKKVFKWVFLKNSLATVKNVSKREVDTFSQSFHAIA